MDKRGIDSAQLGILIVLIGTLTHVRSALAGDDSAARSSLQAPSARSSSIDRWIEEGWKKAGVKPAKVSSDEEFLRRAYLDGVGRIPTIQEARAFLQTRENGKREKLIEYLLAHPDF